MFSGNVVENPRYCALRLANVSDVTVEDNTFISTNASSRLAESSAVVCLWGDAALKSGEKGVVLRRNTVRIAKGSPLRRLWTSAQRAGEVTLEEGGLVGMMRVEIDKIASLPSVGGGRYVLTQGAKLPHANNLEFVLPDWVERATVEDGEIVIYAKPEPFSLRVR